MDLIIISFITLLFVAGLSIGLPVKGTYETIYVDDDNVGGPWYGTVEYPYRYIQDAVENASYGDTIRVYAGIYDNPDNNVYVTKTLSIIGNGSADTLIERSVSISEDDVFFSGFTINGFDYETLKKTCCIRLKNTSSCNINNNTIATGLCGIEFYESHDNIIENNIIAEREVDKPGIYLLSSNANIIRRNHIETDNFGIYLDHSENNIIDDNHITNCSYPIYLILSNNTEIKNNMINKAEEAINIFSSDNNIISGNNINTRDDGIYGRSTNYNLIIDNNIIPKEGSRFGDGIKLLWGCHYNTIGNNNLSDVGYAGLTIGGNDNTIIDNTINSNYELGIYLYSWCHNNTITGNNISNNECGIRSWHVGNSNNTITDNIISKNSNCGISIYGVDNSITYNVISNNGNDGIQIGGTGYTITNNVISNNGNGINFDIQSRDSTINGNTISSNIYYGIKFRFNCHSNFITGNNITNNNEDGIYLDESKNNTITDNTILNNRYGIRFTNSSKKNNIGRNSIASNRKYGIYLEYSFFNRIKKNNFMDNNQSAYFENASFNLWFRNYWDDWSSLIPRPIEGTRYWIFLKKGTPWINFDWRPALRPYDI